MAGTTPPVSAIAAALRRERERVGLTLSELARRAGVAKSTLSQLEAGTGNPSIETLWALGVALGVPFSQLVDPPTPHVRVVRAGEGGAIHSELANVAATLLSAGAPHTRRDLYVMSIEPGPPAPGTPQRANDDRGAGAGTKRWVRESQAHLPGSVEHIVVAAGRLRTGPLDAPIELGPGDYATFRGDAPHHYEALEPGTWAVLMMEHR